MGILDFFRRNKIKGKNNKQQNTQQQETQYPEMELNYRNGIKANIKFKEVVDYQLENGKSAHLQEVEIGYFEEDRFEIKKCYIDPVAMKDENGNYVYDSARYFDELKRNNFGMAKAFFKKENLSNLPSDYIGSLTMHDDGRNPSRTFNQKNGFYAEYIKQYKRKEQEKQEQSKQTQAEKFANELEALTNRGVHIKTDHAEELTPQMRNEMFKDWQR